MTWTAETSQGNEAAKIRWELVEYTNGKGLDLGCGQTKAFPHFIGVDNGHHFGLKNVDVPVETCEDLSLFADKSMDFVFSSHLLEHIKDTKKALAEWYRVIKVGGYLCLYLPHKELYPNVGQPGANTDHKHDFMPEDIIDAMKEVADSWDLVDLQKRSNDNEYSFLVIFRKTTWEENEQILMKHLPDIQALIKVSPVVLSGQVHSPAMDTVKCTT